MKQCLSERFRQALFLKHVATKYITVYKTRINIIMLTISYKVNLYKIISFKSVI
ncbi:glycine cleavage system H protein [Neisseria wadsworthii 9715]|uniref:Glycine cleavage system H protein n=1 Tax=Neisseria wadsworthii 9715 TaxID=1030841 RepID=G4CR25_9NEIS|nr:glycine cleavage system H protein [Neisseria wadsworthii 9715]